MIVWVLVLYMAAFNAGGPAVIDNISTKEECTRIQTEVLKSNRVTWAQCLEVNKMK
jgi:hypothetical protein